MKRLSLLFLLFVSLPVFSQVATKPDWTKYTWEENRKPYTATAAEQKKGAIILKDKRIVETIFEGSGSNSTPFGYYTKHVIVWVNSDNAIEEFNKVYIPMTNVLELVDLQARFISKTGKVTIMNKNSVKDVENYNNYGPYKIFALEGVELGGQVEYLYTVKKPFRMYGTETYRSSYDYRDIELRIVAPGHLDYDAKSYNGLPAITTADDGRNKNVIQLIADTLKGFEEEIYSAQNGSWPRVEYKLAYYHDNHKKRLDTWNDAAERYFQVINDANPAERKMCEALYDRMDVSRISSTEEKIKKIESYLKTHFTVREDASGERYEKIPGIIQTGLATELGVMRLYYTIFDVAGIKTEIVVTSDRFEKQFDGGFDSWTYLQYFLLYFPTTDGMISPTEQFSRYGFVTPNWTSQDGLYIRAVSLGGQTSAVGTIKPIGTTKWEQSISGLYADLSFDLSKGISTVHMKETYTGYSAGFIQPVFSFLSVEDRRDAVEELIRNTADDAKPENLKVRGYASEDSLYNQPFSIEADYTTNSFIENACGKYIFKVGEVIGAQVEMYQPNERRTDMVLQNPHGFYREIRFEVPAGYHVTNLEALNMDVYHVQDSTRTMEFKSRYKQEGRIVTVIVEESYRQTFYPKSIYQDYRKVINASADFNKVVVYFEKDNG